MKLDQYNNLWSALWSQYQWEECGYGLKYIQSEITYINATNKDV
jgi:hypothetical protein